MCCCSGLLCSSPWPRSVFRTIRRQDFLGLHDQCRRRTGLIVANRMGTRNFRAALFGIPWLALMAIRAVPRHPGRWISVAFGVTATSLLAISWFLCSGRTMPATARQMSRRLVSTRPTRQRQLHHDTIVWGYAEQCQFPGDNHYLNWPAFVHAAEVESVHLMPVMPMNWPVSTSRTLSRMVVRPISSMRCGRRRSPLLRGLWSCEIDGSVRDAAAADRKFLLASRLQQRGSYCSVWWSGRPVA